MKSVLLILAFAMYLLNYHICYLAYPDDIISWYKLRGILYTSTFATLFAALNIGATGFQRFFLNIAFSIVVPDLIDRVFFDITTYQWKDLLTLTLTLSTLS